MTRRAVPVHSKARERPPGAGERRKGLLDHALEALVKLAVGQHEVGGMSEGEVARQAIMFPFR